MSGLARAVLIALFALPTAAHAAIKCTVAVPPFNFGNYWPGDPAPLDITGEVDVRCPGNGGQFTTTLSTGGSGTFAQRWMVRGPYLLRYNFYLNAARTIVWGDGTGGSLPVVNTKTQNGREDFVLPVYGRVFPAQAVGGGLYNDDVLVTVIF